MEDNHDRSASPPVASWNPALRPNADHLHSHSHSKKDSISSVDDFFARYPGPTPEKSRSRRVDMTAAADDAEDQREESDSPARRHSISVQHDILLQTEPASVEGMQYLPVMTADISGPLSSHVRADDEQDEERMRGDERSTIFSSDDNAHQQGEYLEGKSNQGSGDLQPEPRSDAQYGEAKALDPSLDYEHQSELTEMEKAVDEAPDAPLMMDPAAPPEVDDTLPRSSMRSVSEASPTAEDLTTQSLPKVGNAHPHVDRSFTTNFTDLPPLEDRVSKTTGPISTGWPEAGDDKTFGELMNDAGDASYDDPGTYLQEPADPVWGAGANDDTFAALLGGTPAKSTVSKPVADLEATTGEADLTAAWQAALDDDDLLDESQDLDPSSFFGNDEDGFLEEEMLDSRPIPVPAGTLSSSHLPATPLLSQQYPAWNDFASAPKQLQDHDHSRSVGTPQTGLYDVYGQAAVQQQSQRPGLPSAQSFVDKAKGGYQSPYDLPMDVAKQPRQRPRPAQTASNVAPTPPPRSSSFSVQPPQLSSRPPTATSTSSGGSLTGLAPSLAVNGGPTAKTTPKTDSGFFADLPMTSKARPRTAGTYTTHNSPSLIAPNAPPPQHHPQALDVLRGPSHGVNSPPATPPVQQRLDQALSHATLLYGGLRQPEQLSLLPEHSSVPQEPPAGPPQSQRYSPNHQATPSMTQNRFSPAPPVQGPQSTARYSPAPLSQPGQPKRHPSAGAGPPTGIQNIHPFAPRTSSPLAQPNEKHRSHSTLDLPQSTPSSPPRLNGFRPSTTTTSEQQSLLGHSPPPSAIHPNASPQRPKTQSPSTRMKAAKHTSQDAGSVMSRTAIQSSTLPHRRQFSRELIFTPPTDERAHDPLERWKGCPVFKWADSGTIVTSFPKHTPFWTAGQSAPNVKCTPGSITIQDASIVLPMNERTVKFPGPLTARAKGKKRDVLTWMSDKIEDLERHSEAVRVDFASAGEAKKLADEKVILWKVVKVFVEQDGVLESNAKTDDEVRAILLPDLAQMGQVMELHTPTSARPSAAEQFDKTALLQLRQALLEGQRERAVWLAEDKKLWGHAMLIASTMGPDVWRKTIQSFIRSEVKSAGSDARSLAALYQVLAGNADECADELVPPSARSGHQFVDMSGTKTNDPLVGLDSWRETLGLIASNRTSNDGPSLLALGKLLSQYGRAEAAHTCFLFARQILKHLGPDDTDAHFVLLGGNHQNRRDLFGSDLDTIILTEIYEWACSLSAPNPAIHYIPHLQSYKLIHAQVLAASGWKSQAQAYCDHITSAYTSTTKPSQYYHPTFTQTVADLSAFLSQTPQAGPQSLLSRGAMNKVSSSASSWFTKFVAGEDDRDSNSSSIGGEETMNGPFGRVSGDSPVLSRAGSTTELYNPMLGAAVPIVSALGQSTSPHPSQPSSAPSRYTPGATRYTPNVSAGDIAFDSRRPSTGAARSSYAPAYVPNNGLGVPRPELGRATSDYGVAYTPDSRRGSDQSQANYEPRPTLPDETSSFAYTTPILERSDMQQQAIALSKAHDVGSLADAEGGYTPSNTTYEPPSATYEPPSYQPYMPDPEAEEPTPVAPAAKKRNQMDIDEDDDDDLAKRAAMMQKAEADRQAEDAFKKVAEADAARSAERKGAGWFGGVGGWFKKDAQTQQQGPVRAKLGEENSFVYDETLKKWVNKKAGSDTAPTIAATPPPPRGPPGPSLSGPPRVASGSGSAGHPPSGPPSRNVTPAGLTGSEAATAIPLPSRPSTSMSNASSLDDLLGGPPGPTRKAAGTVKSKKKTGRYVDVMGTK